MSVYKTYITYSAASGRPPVRIMHPPERTVAEDVVKAIAGGLPDYRVRTGADRSTGDERTMGVPQLHDVIFIETVTAQGSVTHYARNDDPVDVTLSDPDTCLTCGHVNGHLKRCPKYTPPIL